MFFVREETSKLDVKSAIEGIFGKSHKREHDTSRVKVKGADVEDLGRKLQ